MSFLIFIFKSAACAAAVKPPGGAQNLNVKQLRKQTVHLRQLGLQSLLPVPVNKLQEPGLYGRDQSQHGFGTGDQIKGDGESPSLLEVRKPKFRPSKLPFHISVVLQQKGSKEERNTQRRWPQVL